MTALAGLAAALGPGGCLTEPPEAARSDASRSGRERPLALLRPASVAEVSAALAVCHRHGQGVVPQGGMTGLAGGANPRAEDVALSLDRFAGVEEIDADAAAMVLRAGTVLQAAQEAAAEAGFLFPVDLGARGSCRVGGIVSTNAGGVRVIRHGTTRDNLLGLEAVLADGTVLPGLGRVVKNNTGYDLRHLFCGAEGTLGVVTRAVFRLRPLPEARQTALCALESWEAVLALLGRARAGLAGLSAFEAMWREYFAFNAAAEASSPFAEVPPFAVLIEAETAAGDAPRAAFEDFLGQALEAGVIADALIAQSEKEARAFWTLREGHAMDRLLPALINLDVSLAAGRLGAFAETCRARLLTRFPGAHVSFFGHVGDSNLHVAVQAEGGAAAAHEVDALVYALVRDFGGSVSAEHGIGTLKRDWLGHTRSPEEIAAMRAIKAALDPKGIMNPGKVLPPA